MKRLLAVLYDIFHAFDGMPYWPPRAVARAILRRSYASGGAMPASQRRDDTVRVVLSPGRSTRRRPGESWAEAMNRLTDGRDL